VTSEAAAEARRRALRFVGFLEAYYALRYPPVHDLAAYRDVQVAPADVPAVPGVALTGGGEPWLAVELVDLPVPPELPAEVQAWVTGPVTAEEAPRLGPHPDARRRLLPQAAAGPERGVLDGDTLAAGEAEGFPPGQALAELAAAEEDRLQAEEHLAAWTAGDWHPWAERWQAVEAGRALYRTLFDLRVRIEREGELFELVWGFGRLRWQLGGERIDQPLLCTPVEVTMDTRSGRLEVTPAGPTVLDVSWSVDLPVRDRVTLNRLREQLEDEEVDPWTPEAAELLRPVLRAFDHDGVLVPAGGTRPPAGEHAALDPGEWVLYVRRRQPNFRGFLDEQRRLYEAGAAVPDPFATLAVDEASAFADPDPYAATAGDTPGGRGPAGEEEPLLPLAVNEEQLQIVAMARARAGVTAQGPPGTGKSHTIANLISHYVAHGKRVLVTAAKEQALGVLIDKVPEGIRQLCVPVLGSDASARARLQATVTTIADAAHRRPDRSEIARLEADLAGLREGYAATANTLKAKRAAETTIPPVPPRDADTAWTPSSAADWVRRHPELGWVPDRVGPDTPPPVSAEELAELVRHCANLDPAGAEAALAALPPAGELPAGATLGGLRLERSRLLTALADLEHLVVDWVRVDATAPDELARLGEAIRSYAYWHTKIAGTWVARVVDDTADPALVAGWGEFLQAAQADREGALAASRALAADTVTIDGEVDQALRDGLAEARQRFAAGKGVGRFQAGARRALERCRVDGSPPSNVAGLDLVQAELARREWRRRLTTRWHNAVSRVGGPVLGADRPPEDAVGEHLGALRAALAWRPEIWPAVAAQITAAGLRVPAPATADDLAALADTCTGLHRRARLREIDVRLTALAATLEDGSRRPGASSLWVGLAAALAAGADDTWDQLLEQAARLAAVAPPPSGAGSCSTGWRRSPPASPPTSPAAPGGSSRSAWRRRGGGARPTPGWPPSPTAASPPSCKPISSSSPATSAGSPSSSSPPGPGPPWRRASTTAAAAPSTGSPPPTPSSARAPAATPPAGSTSCAPPWTTPRTPCRCGSCPSTASSLASGPRRSRPSTSSSSTRPARSASSRSPSWRCAGGRSSSATTSRPAPSTSAPNANRPSTSSTSTSATSATAAPASIPTTASTTSPANASRRSCSSGSTSAACRGSSSSPISAGTTAPSSRCGTAHPTPAGSRSPPSTCPAGSAAAATTPTPQRPRPSSSSSLPSPQTSATTT